MMCIFMCLQRPLALAKILGAYTVGYRNTRTGNSKRLDVIVMENLLYGRKSSKVRTLINTVLNSTIYRTH